MICKALLRQPALQRAALLDRFAPEIAAEKRRRIKSERALSLDDFEPALELATFNGWLAEVDGALRLTAQGEDLARRSRTGRNLGRIDLVLEWNQPMSSARGRIS